MDVETESIAECVPGAFTEAQAVASRDGISCHEAEQQVIGASHGQIGGYLLGLWAFEPAIVDAAVYHHCPRQHTSKSITVLTTVHAADVIIHQEQDETTSPELDIDEEYLARVGVADRVQHWRSKCLKAA